MRNDKQKTQIKIGIEIHVTLSSSKKIFNLNETFNDNRKAFNIVEHWELGYLGTLPIINKEAVYLALKLCLFLKLKVAKNLDFDRKIYNYFDLPKGFQITQQRNPIGRNGFLLILVNEKIKKIPISRIQIEEDTAKVFYSDKKIGLDFNRAGNPLIEIVTDPVFSDFVTLSVFIRQLQNLLRYLNVSEARMERGQFRIDLNFSFNFATDYQTPRYEVKNLNSLKNLKKTLDQEFEKHFQLFKADRSRNHLLKSATMTFDEQFQKTLFQREKMSYYFLPEINIPIIKISPDEINKVKMELPVSPWEIWKKTVKFPEIKNGKLLFENHFLLSFINLLESKRISYLESFDNLTFFLSSCLVTSLHDLDENKISNFIEENISAIWKIFIFWKDRLISKAEASDFILSISSGENDASKIEEQVTKIDYKKKAINYDILEKAVDSILEKTKVNQKTLLQPTKLTNFLFGKLKIKFPKQIIDYCDVESMSLRISRRASK